MSDHNKKPPPPPRGTPTASSSQPICIPARIGLMASSLSSLPPSVDPTTKPTPTITKISFQEIARVFEECIEVKDRRYRLRTYKECFIGTDAVSLLLDILQKIEKMEDGDDDAAMFRDGSSRYTRKHAVVLGRAIAEKFNLFAHVTNDHMLMDDYYMYRFTSKEKRSRSGHRFGYKRFSATSSSSISLSSIISEGDKEDTSERQEEDDKAGDEIKSVDSRKVVDFAADDTDDVEETKHYLEQLLSGHITTDLDASSVVYDEIAAMGIMTHCVFGSTHRHGSLRDKIKQRTQQNKSSSGSSSVVSSGGGSWMSSGSMISSSSSLPSFEFTTSGGSGRSPLTSSRRKNQISITTVHEHLSKYDIDLLQVAHEFEAGVQVGTHRYRGTSYKETFVGSDAVDFILKSRYATTRQDAVIIGIALMKEYNLFQHVAKQHDFKDNYYFYRFTDKNERTGGLKPQSSIVSLDEELPASATTGDDTATKIPTATTDKRKQYASFEQLGEYLEKNAVVEDRRYRLKTYKQCFVGSQLVSLLMDTGCCSDRTQAVEVGRRVAKQLNLFQHVAGPDAHQLEDDYYFYRFIEKEKRTKPDGVSQPWILVSNSVGQPGPSTGGPAISSVELTDLAKAFQKGVTVETHVYRFKQYKKTFIGSEAVDYMVNSDLAPSRKEAVRLGQRLLEELNLFHHVTRDHGFRDDRLFYRFAKDEDGESGALEVSLHAVETPTTWSKDKLDKIAADMRREVKVKNRRWYHKLYKNCFLGFDAVTYLVNSGYAKTRDDAVKLGRELARSCKLLVHVEGDHELKDEKLFYYFVPEEFAKKDLVSLRLMANQFLEGVAVKDHRYRLRVYHDVFVGSEAVEFLVRSGIAKSKEEAVDIGQNLASTFRLFEHVTRDHNFQDEYYFYRFLPEDERLLWRTSSVQEPSTLAVGRMEESAEWSWIQRMYDFEERVLSKTAADLASVSRAVLWAYKFRRLDPRWRILKFFNEVAQLGVENKIENGIETDNLPYLVRLFNRASVFTVWRPTAYDAIRKMMLGQAVGKGLDIKGKSAKRGKNAGFVPFLQIGDNRHKRSIRALPKTGTIRLFFTQDGFSARDEVCDRLEEVAKEMLDTVAEAKLVLSGEKDADDEDIEEAKEVLLWDMENPEIEFIDDYGPQSYGLDLPIRLFWEAFIVRQDITRKPGSQYDVGRPSTPDFQDMNVYALLARPASKDSPKAVVVQNDKSDPMNPHELLMAYEERGLRRVLPVASDFDAFLVGTRRVHFDPVAKPLPPDQVDVLKWCVNHIGNVMRSPPRPESWTNRWLEILKVENSKGFHPTIPKFGFGDPMSYLIMEKAVQALTTDGAVRHGAECFNYYFPQELDDEFLVISDKFGQIPWKYMDQEELQEFLMARVDDGFTFPLNPKWVLCDPGWKPLYDKLLKCNANEDVRNSMDIWFPKDSGVREQIEELCSKYPYGFERGIRDDL